MIGLVTVTAAGRSAAARLATAWPGRTRLFTGSAATDLPVAFAECEAVVAFLATGATVRLLAPALAAADSDKATDPAVVCVDQAGRYAVSLLGGHLGGANQLARQVAEILGAEAVVTTGTDAAGVPGLDDLGLPVEGDVAGVSRAVLDGAPVALVLETNWPLPAFPNCVTVAPEVSAAGYEIVVTDRVVTGRPGRVVLHPPTLVLGVGASRGAPADEMADLVDGALAEAGLAAASVRMVVTAEIKAAEPAVLALANRLGVPLETMPAALLAAQTVPNPSEVVMAAIGSPSVAEAAVVAAGACLVVEKVVSAAATVAVGRHSVRGRLAIVGIGPGARDLITPRAVAEIRAASVVVGLDQYLTQVQDLFRPGTTVRSTGMGSEQDRVRSAVTEAQAGRAVALIGSGDAGVYAMASPAWEILDAAQTSGAARIDVVGVPGITAALAASTLLGAPLGNDHAYISLSDLHTPWQIIERRLVAAAEGDFTVALYNPRSRGRAGHLTRALEILGTHRPPTTPVGLVRNAARPGERIAVTTLVDVEPEEVDMLTVVIVGASATRIVDGHMVTPRGYRWMS